MGLIGEPEKLFIDSNSTTAAPHKRLALLLPVIAKVLGLHIFNGQRVPIITRTHLSTVRRLQGERVLEPRDLKAEQERRRVNG